MRTEGLIDSFTSHGERFVTNGFLSFSFAKVGVGLESKLQEWFHLPQDMASPRWVEEIWGNEEYEWIH